MYKIIGTTGNIQNIDDFLKKINTLSKTYHIIIQALNADFVYNKDHLVSAVEHALRSFQSSMNSLNSLALEILLYASGERQIQKAIKKIGIQKDNQNIAVIIVSENNKRIPDDTIKNVLSNLHLIRDDKVLEGDIDTLQRFGIKEIELQTLPKDKYADIILERVALVDIIK